MKKRNLNNKESRKLPCKKVQMKSKKHPAEIATKAGLAAATMEVTAMKRTRHGPKPERFKITGYANWEDAVSIGMKKPRPPGGCMNK